MITPVAQRWREHRDTYRPIGETIRPSEYDVAPLDETRAKGFVVAHHYAASYPAARFRTGLYRFGILVGVAVFSHPVTNLALRPFDGADEAVELGRFVCLDDEPGVAIGAPSNAETWFLARAFALVRRELDVAGVVSFSDPMARTDAGGREVFKGHIGTIYQGHNAVYLGPSRRNTVRLFPDGRVLNNRAISKVRGRERGWRHVVGELEAHGAERYRDGDLLAWLHRAIVVTTRAVRHPGNHKYAWAIDRRVRRHLPESKPYPKFEPRAGGTR